MRELGWRPNNCQLIQDPLKEPFKNEFWVGKLAKGSTKSGSSRIRFIMLEADLSDGDLSQVTTAIQNALRPAQPTTRVIQIPMGKTPEELEAITEDQLNGEMELEPAIAPEPKRSRSPSSQKRSFPTPKVVPVDWNLSPSVETFMKDYPPKTTNDKFLAVLGWFKEAADKEAISVDEVYTVFRKLGWPTSIKDFSQPLRDLKGQQVIGGGAKGAHLRGVILSDAQKLADFNSTITVRLPKSKVQVRTADDFDDLKEFETIDIAQTAKIISKNVAEIMKDKLKRRNRAAHPSSIEITQPQADDVVTDLINNVVLKLA